MRGLLNFFQVPRFTTMLRSFAATGGTADLAAQYLQRKQLLDSKLKDRRDTQVRPC